MLFLVIVLSFFPLALVSKETAPFYQRTSQVIPGQVQKKKEKKNQNLAGKLLFLTLGIIATSDMIFGCEKKPHMSA